MIAGTSPRRVRYLLVVSRTAAPAPPRIHRAWWVAAVVLGALVAAAGFRSSTGALLEPLESEFGWSPRDHLGRGDRQPGDLRAHRSVRRGPDGALRHPPRGRAWRCCSSRSAAA